MRPATRRAARALVLLLPVLACVLPVPRLEAQAAAEAAARYAGRPLAEALLELRAQGLRIVFTNKTVQPGMTVEVEPTEREPRRILDQLLAPHGLTARDGPSGSVVVVAGVAATSMEPLFITGSVRARGGGAPIAGVELQLVETGTQVTSDIEGSFRLPAPGPGTFNVDVRRRGFVIEHLAGVVVSRSEPSLLAIELDRAPVTEEQVVVTPSRVSLMREAPAMPLALSRSDILSLPQLGDDFFRALSLLPGVTANDVSAEFHVRGGRSDETQVLLDGQELYESYHLKDFDNALSVVAATTLDSVDLSTGGFPVEHGDRMSGVLDMTTRTPTGPRRSQVGLSLLNFHLGSTGTFADGRGGWLVQGRRGAIDLASKLLGPENPQYWDAFGKLDFQLTPQQSLRANVLHSNDELEFEQVSADGFKSRETHYASSYLWFTHQAIVGSDLLVETATSRSRIDRDRQGLELEDDAQFEIDDRRELEVFGLRQDWSWRLAPRHSLKWGFGLRRFEAIYDYHGSYNFESPLAHIRENSATGAIFFAGAFDADHSNLYLADRVRIGNAATLEIGLRHDNHSLTDESLVSPRLNFAVNLAPRSVLRASWGRFTQSQRAYELQVEDGETGFHPVERSEHQVLGVEHLFGGEGELGPTVRVEVYRRNIENPLPRYENLYEPINTFPEVEPDRVLIAPRSSRSEGLEVFVRGRPRQVGWWLNYTYSKSEDDLAGVRTVRRFDQTHALNLDFDFRLSEKWTFNLAWRFHTGWPTTPLTLEEVIVLRPDEDGELEPESEFLPVLGPRWSARLPDYHRLDLRASRRWQAGAAAMTFFVDIQNAYDRRNISGFDYEVDEDAGRLIATEENWAQILPSLGISIEF